MLGFCGIFKSNHKTKGRCEMKCYLGKQLEGCTQCTCNEQPPNDGYNYARCCLCGAWHYAGELCACDVENLMRCSVEGMFESCCDFCPSGDSPICLSCMSAREFDSLSPECRDAVMKAYKHFWGTPTHQRPRWLASQIRELIKHDWYNDTFESIDHDTVTIVLELANLLDPFICWSCECARGVRFDADRGHEYYCHDCGDLVCSAF